MVEVWRMRNGRHGMTCRMTTPQGDYFISQRKGVGGHLVWWCREPDGRGNSHSTAADAVAYAERRIARSQLTIHDDIVNQALEETAK